MTREGAPIPPYQRALELARQELGRNRPSLIAELAGAEWVQTEDESALIVAYMDGQLDVSLPDGIVRQADEEASVWVTVVVLHYLSRSVGPLDLADPVRFAGLHDAAPFAEAFHTRVEHPLAHRFGRDGRGFVRAVTALGGRAVGHEEGSEPSPEIIWEIPFLPHLPLGVRLGLTVGGLPPKCVLLFPRRAGVIYPAEDLAVAGELLALRLLEIAGPAVRCESSDELVLLTAVYDPVEAEIIVAKLRGAGIESVLRHDALSVVYGLTVNGLGRQEIMVRREDLEIGQLLLSSEGGPGEAHYQ